MNVIRSLRIFSPILIRSLKPNTFNFASVRTYAEVREIRRDPIKVPDEPKPRKIKKQQRKERMQVKMSEHTFKEEAVTKPLAKSFDLEALRQASRNGDDVFWVRYRIEYVPEFDHVLHVHLKSQYQNANWLREFYVFEEGVATFWGMDPHEIADVTENILDFATDIVSENVSNEETEKMTFTLSTQGKNCIVKNDIHLTDTSIDVDGILKRFTFSRGVAANVKLSVWEEEMERIMRPFEHLSKDLLKGKIWTIKTCKKHLGQLSEFRYRSNLKSELFDTDVFWDYPQLEEIYKNIKRYYDIESRQRRLNNDIDHCENLLKNAENIVFHEKSWKLEWYIIILISLEIVLNIDKFINCLKSSYYYLVGDAAVKGIKATQQKNIG